MMAPPATTAPPTGPVLRDIHLPPAPPWWPPAPGWWLLAVLVLALLLAAAWWWRRWHRQGQRRRRILGELDRLAARHRRDGDAAALAGGLHQLLRRVAREHDAQAVRQRGEAWRRTLARVAVDAATLEQLQALEQQLYRPPAAFDHVAALAAVRRWLQRAAVPSAWKPAAAEPFDA